MSDEELAALLEGVAEDLGERILHCLREAASATEGGGDPPPSLLAEEKRLSRARRSVVKAMLLLRPFEINED